MAVSQNQLAHMEWCQVWEPSIPSGTTTAANKQQLIWGYPGIAYGGAVPPEATPRARLMMKNVGRMMH